MSHKQLKIFALGIIAVFNLGSSGNAQTIRQWQGITGNRNWNIVNGGHWNSSVPDNSSEIGRIANSSTHLQISSATSSYTINGVQILSGGSSVSVRDGRALTLVGTSSQIVSGANLYIGIAPTATGAVTSGGVFGNTDPSTLLNNGVIQGAGTISVGFTNNGHILANQDGRTLMITGGSSTGAKRNAGVLLAAEGGILFLSAEIENADGAIHTTGSGRVEYAGGKVMEGNISGFGHEVTAATTFADVRSSSAGLDVNAVLTIESGFEQVGTASTTVGNSGTIEIDGFSNVYLQTSGTFQNNGNVTLSGDGAIELHGTSSNTGTIQGTGTVLATGSGLVNTGDITANGLGSLSVQGVVTNSGTISADTGMLLIGGGVDPTVITQSGAGVISGGAGGMVDYNNATINSGSLVGGTHSTTFGELTLNDVAINAELMVSGFSLTATSGSIASTTGTAGSLTLMGGDANYSGDLYVGGSAAGAGGMAMVQVGMGNTLGVGDALHIYDGSNVMLEGTLAATDIILDGTIDGSGSLVVGAGQSLSGSGSFSTLGGGLTIENGGVLAPGNSTGEIVGAMAVTFGSGGVFELEVNDFNGTAGSTTAGWDLLNVDLINVAASGGSPFVVDLVSLDALQAAGMAQNFDGASPYSLMFASTAFGITGFDPSLFSVDTSGFQNVFAGTWSVSQTGNDLFLDFTAASVPEPSSVALLGLCTFGLIGRRRQRIKAC